MKATLVEIGAPVFSGGFSTFLAFVLLAGSNSYVFTTFFKVSTIVTIGELPLYAFIHLMARLVPRLAVPISYKKYCILPVQL